MHIRDDDDDDDDSGSINDDSSLYVKKEIHIVDPYGERGVYSGELSTSSGLPNGNGRIDYENKEGRFYKGEWVNGRWTGIGTFANGNGDLYQGGFNEDHKHGKGIMKFADGRIYEGEYIRGEMIQGKMTYQQDGSFYTGPWVAGKRHGNGKCVFVDGSEYDGEWSEGNFHGQGKMIWADGGGYYVGEWNKGQQHGRGKEIRADGTLRHEGEWNLGQPTLCSINASNGLSSSPLPKCFCNWRYCRTFQKAFREYRHPFFNGVIKFKFRRSNRRSMALKSTIDRTLHVESVKRHDWKLLGDDEEPFCRYYVARHHFTEALIKEYLQDRHGWDWNRPLSIEEAEKFLWSLDRDDIYHSEDEESDEDEDRYVQAPNVPKNIVREMLKKLRDQHKKALVAESAPTEEAIVDTYRSTLTIAGVAIKSPKTFEESVLHREHVSKEATVAEKEEENRRLRDEIQECQRELNSIRDLAKKLQDKHPNLPKDMVHEMTSWELEDQHSINNKKTLSTEAAANKQEATESVVEESELCSKKKKDTLLDEKKEEEENRRLRDECQECRKQLDSLRDMVKKVVGRRDRYKESDGGNIDHTLPRDSGLSKDELEVAKDTSYVKDKLIVDLHGQKGFYTGELSRSTTMPNGKGRMEYEQEGGWYDGEWKYGYWNGNGSLTNGNGDFYKGGLKNSLRHGKGVFKFADGGIFEGEYIRGHMIQGKMTYQDGSTYTGSWADDMRHGKGKSAFVDGSEYDGEFREGNFEGHGKMKWVDGGWYVGEWSQGEIHGLGKEIRADGSLKHGGRWERNNPISNDAI